MCFAISMDLGESCLNWWYMTDSALCLVCKLLIFFILTGLTMLQSLVCEWLMWLKTFHCQCHWWCHSWALTLLGSPGCEWMGLLYFQVCWKWLSLALQDVSDRASFILKPSENGCSCSPACEWQGLLYFLACWKWLSLDLQLVSDRACFVSKPAENGCPWLSSQWVIGLALFSSLLKMVVLGSPVSEWQGLLCFQVCWKWLSLALQSVSDRACFVFKPAENGCPWLSSQWVTGLAFFSSLLKMVVLGSPECEWQGLLCFQACWKWLSLALQYVSDRACFVFKPAENGCPWLSRRWVTGLALFSSLLKMIVLGSSGSEWQGLLCFQACWNSCPWLSRGWVTGLAFFSSLLKMVVLGSPEGEWQGLLSFQACWKWLSLALQRVSDRACFVFKPAEHGCPWLSRMWVAGLAFFSSLLKMVVLGSLVGEWQGLLCFQAFWKWLSLALQLVSDRACFVSKPAENGCFWPSRRWATGCLICKPVNNAFHFLECE